MSWCAVASPAPRKSRHSSAAPPYKRKQQLTTTAAGREVRDLSLRRVFPEARHNAAFAPAPRGARSWRRRRDGAVRAHHVAPGPGRAAALQDDQVRAVRDARARARGDALQRAGEGERADLARAFLRPRCSGYVPYTSPMLGSTHYTFHWIAESQGDPTKDPILFWTNVRPRRRGGARQPAARSRARARASPRVRDLPR